MNYIDAFHFGFGQPRYDSAGVFQGWFADMYVYDVGVVSFGNPLPLTASLAGGTASLGNGDWFAAGFGAPLTHMASFQSGNGNRWINWDDNAGNILFQLEIHNTGGSFNWNPRDIHLADFTVFYWGPGRPGGDLEAYHTNADTVFPDLASQLYASGCPSVAFGGAVNLGCPGSFNADLRGAGTPEPMTWALMVTGLAAVGAALRRRRRLEA